jgi:hypothetical protein
MLCLADRGFVGFELWQSARATSADLLWRVKSNQKFACYKRLPRKPSTDLMMPNTGSGVCLRRA